MLKQPFKKFPYSNKHISEITFTLNIKFASIYENHHIKNVNKIYKDIFTYQTLKTKIDILKKFIGYLREKKIAIKLETTISLF